MYMLILKGKKVRILVETYNCTWFLVLVQRNRKHWHDQGLAEVLLLESTPIWEIPDYDDDEDLEDEPWRCLLSRGSSVISLESAGTRLDLAIFRTPLAVLRVRSLPSLPRKPKVPMAPRRCALTRPSELCCGVLEGLVPL